MSDKKLELSDKEKQMIKECLLVVAKLQNVGVEQMEELINLSKKF